MVAPGTSLGQAIVSSRTGPISIALHGGILTERGSTEHARDRKEFGRQGPARSQELCEFWNSSSLLLQLKRDIT